MISISLFSFFYTFDITYCKMLGRSRSTYDAEQLKQKLCTRSIMQNVDDRGGDLFMVTFREKII